MALLRVLAVLATLLVLPAAALADGDPASDVLLGENVFYPYQPPVSGAVQKTLNAETAAARKAGYPIKVALIASPIDLGVIPDLFGKPQRYADFLDQEISFRTRQPLLVVMSTGYGIQGFGSSARSAVAKLPRPAGKTSEDLAKAAIVAVSKIAAAGGHPIAGAPGAPSSTSSGGSEVPLIAGLAIAALLVAGGLIFLRRRHAASSPG